MLKRLLLIPITGLFTLSVLTGGSAGAGGNLTGSDGSNFSNGYCNTSGCHHDAGATNSLTVTVRIDSAGIPVTKYVGGRTYTIVLIDTTFQGSTLPGHGFQCSIVKGTGASSTQAGTFSVLPANTALHTTAGRSIWEQTASIGPVVGAGDAGSVFVDSVKWTAPPSGTGSVTLYSVMLNANLNGVDDNFDSWNRRIITIPERGGSTEANMISPAANVYTYPNPVTNVLNIKLPSIVSTSYKVTVHDLRGHCITTQEVIANTAGDLSMPTNDWPSGQYVVTITGSDNNVTIVPFIKQ